MDQIDSGASHDNMEPIMDGLVAEFMSNAENQRRIRNIVGRGNRLNVSIDEVRHFNPKLANYVKNKPIQAIKMFETHLNSTVNDIKEGGGKQNQEKQAVRNNDAAFPTKTQCYYVNFEGNFGKNYVTPRGLKAPLVGQFVQVQGIVTKMSLVKPKIKTSVHFCESTKQGMVKHYNDKFDLTQLGEGDPTDTNNAFPTKDGNDNALSAEYGYCVYKDSQTVVIQELPENAPAGQLPRSITVLFENDLVDKCKPGDRVQVSGVFRVIHRGLTGDFRSILVATGVQSLLAEKEKPNMSEQDIKNIRKLAKDKDAFNIIGESIAPSIEGSLDVKKSVLLQLLGGAEKILPNGTHLRGDINLLMVGDPSTAKSQLLRHVMDIAPLALNTTGRGSSGVGLTAAVTVDKDTNERHLEAGAMVLADRGIVCIDEFDKMNDADRVAIHEVMEQQTVTIAKAGIHTTLNARCSVIAAANPIYSEYARDQSVGKNIGLPDSLLSRFDLLFIMLDEKEARADRKIAERVITNHRFHDPNADSMAHFNFANDDYVVEPEMRGDKDQGKGTTMFEKHMKKTTHNVTRNVITRDFLKKFLSFVKSQKAPEIDQQCIDYAAQLYAFIRQKAAFADQNKISCPVTVRTLETVIRLATAHSKIRLSKAVTTNDIDIALSMVHLSIFGEPLDKQDEEEEEDDAQDLAMDTGSKVTPKVRMEVEKKKVKFNKDQDAEFEDQSAQPAVSKRTTRRQTGVKVQQEEEEPTAKKMKVDEDEAVSQLLRSSISSHPQKVELSVKKFVFKLISDISNAKRTSRVSINEIWQKFFTMSNEQQKNSETNSVFLNSKEDLKNVLEQMEADDLTMMDGNDVVLTS